MKTTRIEGLYAITPDLNDTGELLRRAEQVLRGGASVLQYRNKLADYALKREQASELMWLCEDHGVPFIINDHVLLCVELDADGVHLGGQDGDIAAARRLLGAHKLIGASCYNRLELAVQARDAGADYVAFGACFPSETKPEPVHAPLGLFAQARQAVGLPMVAIGGISPDNVQQVMQAGADAVAVISAIFDAADDQQARVSAIVEKIAASR